MPRVKYNKATVHTALVEARERGMTYAQAADWMNMPVSTLHCFCVNFGITLKRSPNVHRAVKGAITLLRNKGYRIYEPRNRPAK